MSGPFRRIGPAGRARIVAIADHASNHVPDDIDLGIDPALLNEHIALDIGVEQVAERLAAQCGIPGYVATVSRLVCDFNRVEGDRGAVPMTSDGHAVPGNPAAVREDRLARFHRPYHAGLTEFLTETQPALILALHSFTPALKSRPEARPWEVALLHNRDDRAARLAIPLFAAMGLTVGDNQPYSGIDLNATMDRHAEAAGILYIALEIRQDQIADAAGQRLWADRVAEVAQAVASALHRREAKSPTPPAA